MKITLSVILILFISLNLKAQSNNGEAIWETVKCGNVTANLQMNMRTITQPTLFLNTFEIKLEEGPDYGVLVCVSYQGEKKIGFVESMGNAYETYRIVDLDTFKMTEITYAIAEKIGFYKE